MPDVNQQIREAMERGDFDNLPNKGKPLDLSGNPFENPQMRLAYKILKDNGYAPPWIELEKEIRSDLERKENLLTFLKRRRQRLVELIEEAPRNKQSIAKTFELECQRSLDSFYQCLVEVNKKIDKFNLIVPIPDKRRKRVSIEMEIDRFKKECPSL
ncbi:MAG: DnaJ family domain-containing protein [Candidatus Poribacteria bacterium]